MCPDEKRGNIHPWAYSEPPTETSRAHKGFISAWPHMATVCEPKVGLMKTLGCSACKSEALQSLWVRGKMGLGITAQGGRVRAWGGVIN